MQKLQLVTLNGEMLKMLDSLYDEFYEAGEYVRVDLLQLLKQDYLSQVNEDL